MTAGANVIPHDNLARRQRIAVLLKQYPAVSESELGELVEFYKTAPAIETALISCDTELTSKIMQFGRENSKAIERGMQAPLVVMVFILCLVFIAIGFFVHMSGFL